MKKVISLFIVCIFVLVFCGCSSGKQYSDTAINCAKKAVQYGNDYINGYINADEAEKKLEELEDDLSEYISSNPDLPTVENDKWINGRIDLLKFSMSTESISSITEHITELEKMINN